MSRRKPTTTMPLTGSELATMLRAEVRQWQKMPNAAVGAWIKQAFILRAGKRYTQPIAPKPSFQGPPKNCFRNAMHMVKRTPQTLRYVEGYALRKGIPFPLHHAWVCFDDGRFYDPTWDDQAECEYIGVAVTRDEFKRWASTDNAASLLVSLAEIANLAFMLHYAPDMRAVIPDDLFARWQRTNDWMMSERRRKAAEKKVRNERGKVSFHVARPDQGPAADV